MRQRLPSISVHQHHFRERLVEEIKRLLEEIIDSHPEALEAIESVRQAKLASVSRLNRDSEESENQAPSSSVMDDDQPGTSTGYLSYVDERRGRRHSRGRRSMSSGQKLLPRFNTAGTWNSSRAEPNSLLAELVSKPGTHVATCHDDTTEGAVHCFQVRNFFREFTL